MNNLVTGGAGFVGSHLCEALLARGEQVTVIDDLSTGSITNLDGCRDHPRLDVRVESVENASLLAELIDRADRIYHLAAAVGVKLILQSPVTTIEKNVRLTELVLKLASKKAKKTFIASTSEVYGKSGDIPFREDGDLVLGATTLGRWSYACSKAIDEFLAIAYWHERGLPTVIGRLFNTVGPRQSAEYGMVVPRFVRQALANEPITVYGDGSQSRCFTHVADSVRAIIGLMDAADTTGEVFNIGNPEEITIGDLATTIRDCAGSQSTIVLVPYGEAYRANFEDMARRVPSIEKIGKRIGWAPEYGLDDILTAVIGSHEPQPAAGERP